MAHTRRLTALLTLAPAPLLALLGPPVDGPTRPLLVLVWGTAWACTGWLVLVAVLTWASALSGAPGRGAARVLARVAPAPVRALVRVAVGASLAATVLAGPAALAADRAPTIAGSASDALDWPGLALGPGPGAPAPAAQPPLVAGPTPDTRSPGPASPEPSVPAAPTTTAPTTTAPPIAATPPNSAASHLAVPVDAHPRLPAVPASPQVVVHAGDSLWAIAQRELGNDATQRQVARAWPRWWAANREVIGDDPDLIHPGDRLTAP